MSENILEKILKNKRKKIDILKKSITANELDTRIQQHNNFIDYANSLDRSDFLDILVELTNLTDRSPLED